MNWSLLIFTVSLIIRVIFLITFQDNLLFSNHIVDMLYHHEWASAIASGNEYYEGPFFRAPLYPLIIGVIYYIFGIGDWAFRIFQAIIGSFSVVLIFLIGARVFNMRVAVIAGLMTALCGSLIFFEGLMLGVTFAIFFNLLGMLFLIKGIDGFNKLNFITAGLFLGLSAVTRPNILFFVIVFMIWYLWIKRDVLKQTIKHLLIIACGLIIPVLPVTIYNYSQSGDLTLIGAYGGINLYIANNKTADGVSPVIPGVRQDWWGGKEDTKRLAETEAKRTLTEAEQSDFWYQKAIAEIKDDPVRFFKLLVKKTVLLLNGFELSNNFDFYFFAFQNSILKFLIWRTFLFFPWGVILPLAVVGIFRSWRSGISNKVLLLFLLGYSISVILFLVSARYRLPLLPVLILTASYGGVSIYDDIKKSKHKKAVLWILVFILGLFMSNYDFYGYSQTNYAHGYHTAASIWAKKRNLFQAEKNYRLALKEDPNLSSSINDLSLIMISKGNVSEAIELLEHGEKANPDDQMLKYNLGFAYLNNSQPDLAIRPLHNFLLEMPDNIYGLNNLGLAYMRINQLDSAVIYFMRAIAVDESYFPAYQNLVLVYKKKNDPDSTEYWYNRILDIPELSQDVKDDVLYQLETLNNQK